MNWLTDCLCDRDDYRPTQRSPHWTSPSREEEMLCYQTSLKGNDLRRLSRMTEVLQLLTVSSIAYMYFLTCAIAPCLVFCCLKMFLCEECLVTEYVTPLWTLCTEPRQSITSTTNKTERPPFSSGAHSAQRTLHQSNVANLKSLQHKDNGMAIMYSPI